jgi:nucleotide-binding universal stress UspA family protein
MSSSMAGLIKDLRNSHEGVLINGAEKAAKTKPTVKVTTELREGDPPTQIVLAAQEGNFEIIVLGQGSESRIREQFLVGTSERVAQMARCAVLFGKQNFIIFSKIHRALSEQNKLALYHKNRC